MACVSDRSQESHAGFVRARHSPFRLVRHLSVFSFACVWTITVWAFLLQRTLCAQTSVSAEYRAKAAFLTVFPSFVDWSETSFSGANSPVVVCVRGDFLFGTSLAENARAAFPHGRSMEIRWMHSDPDLRSCHLLFVTRSESKRYRKLLQGVRGAHILTIGETPDFLEAGGVIAFAIRGDVLEFDVNLTAANQADLRISSRLLTLAPAHCKSSECRHRLREVKWENGGVLPPDRSAREPFSNNQGSPPL